MRLLPEVFAEGSAVAWSVSPTRVVFEADGRRLVSRLVDATYPDWRRVITPAMTEGITIEAADAIAAIRRLRALRTDAKAPDMLTVVARPAGGGGLDASARRLVEGVGRMDPGGRLDAAEVKARTDLGALIGREVALKTAGPGRLVGLCPFHNERTPSFSVRPDKGVYYCFGCGTKGDAITWAIDLWRGASASERGLVTAYLRARGITLPLPH